MVGRMHRTCLLVLLLTAWSPALARRGDVPETTALCFLPDGKTLLAAGLDGRVHIFDVASRKETSAFAAHTGGVWSAALSPNGKTLITGGGDKLVKLWDAGGYKLLQTFEGSAQALLAVALSPDGKLLAGGGADGVICTWDVATGKRTRFWRAHEFCVLSLAFSPDGDVLASGGTCAVASANLIRGVVHADHVRLWDARTGKEIRQLAMQGSSVAYAPDARTIAAAGYHVAVQPRENAVVRPLLRAETLAGITLPMRDDKTIEMHDAGSTLALSSDGRMVALAYGSRRHVGSDRFIQEPAATHVAVWEMATGKLIREYEQGDATVVAIAPGGKVLAAGIPFVGIRFWDLTIPEPGGAKDEKAAAPSVVKLWDDLVSPEAKIAYPAIWALGAHGQGAVEFLAARLKPVEPPGRDVTGLVAKLDHEAFATREQAFRQLRLFGTAVEGELRKALQNPKASAESRQRILKLLDKMDQRPAGPEELRELRALQVLAVVGSESARAVVARIGAGAADAWFTQQAQVTLARWQTR
jgi:WD40 repeat protein